jgi:hypothetical protein
MKKLYVCPHCAEDQSFGISGYEDGGGDDSEGITAVYECFSCGLSFTEDEGFWGYEDEDTSGNPDLNEVSGGYDR